MENINQLICYLLAIANFAKDIHYTCHGEAFYTQHLLADRIYDGLYELMDSIKESLLLGSGFIPLPSKDYNRGADDLTPDVYDNNDKANFENMKGLIERTIAFIDKIDLNSRADNKLLDDVAGDLKEKLGLINLQVKE